MDRLEDSETDRGELFAFLKKSMIDATAYQSSSPKGHSISSSSASAIEALFKYICDYEDTAENTVR
jgi:hypothetical protein